MKYRTQVCDAAHVSPVTKLILYSISKTQLFVGKGLFLVDSRILHLGSPNASQVIPSGCLVPCGPSQTSWDVYDCVCERLRWVRRSG